jgi:hypothetical protein
MASPQELETQLKARVAAAVQRAPAPPRREVRRTVVTTLLTAVAVPLVAFFLVGAVRPGPRPWSLVLLTSVGTLGLAVAAVLTAYGRGGQMLGPARVRLLAMTVAAPVTFVAWKLAWSLRYDHMTDEWATRPGYRCLALTFLFALWPFLALARIRRGSDPTHPRTLGAALGVATGTSAAFLVDLWCPVGNLSHVLLGHVLPIVALGLIGIWVGHRVLSLRARDR